MTEQELIALKQQIDKAKSKVSELQGQKQYLAEELREKHDCKTIKEAEILSTKMSKDIESMESEIEKNINKIREDYNV